MNTIRIGNAPVSWGIVEFDLEGESTDFRRVLDEIAETGYDGTELGDWGFLPTDPADLSRELRERNLELIGAFVPVAFADPDEHGPGVNAALRTARLLAAVNERAVVVLADDNGRDLTRVQHAGRIRAEHGLTPPEWDLFAEGAERVARVVRDETGLTSVFHPHCAGFVETPEELQALLDRTDPGLIGICFDTGHYAYGGGDVLDGLTRHWARIRHLHFKDCDAAVAERARAEGWDYFEAVRRGVFCQLGEGTVDFPSIVSELNERNYPGWVVVEQDVFPGIGSPYESARRNLAYLKQLGL